MEKQDYEHHIRYYYPHHFIFYPVLLVLLAAAGYCVFAYPEQRLIYAFIFILIFLAGWLSYMLRQHYALTLQNRIVRAEMRFRYYRLTGKAFEDFEEQLSFGQISALRFADDEQLPALTERTLRENLKPDVIKHSVTNWKADHNRV